MENSLRDLKMHMIDSIPKGFDGYVWTNRIDKIDKKLKSV